MNEDQAVAVIAEFLADGPVSAEEYEGYVEDAWTLLEILWREGWLVVPARPPGEDR